MTSKSHMLRLSVFCTSIFLIFNSQSAENESTQSDNVKIDNKNRKLEVIEVSARKKNENIQKMPISIVSVSGDYIEKIAASDLSSLNSSIPNVAIAGSGGLGSSNAAFYIRGAGTSRNALNQESTVALYIDDEYIGRSDGALLQLLDIDHVEVLRGPQGTLFGRSATAGALRYITTKPSDEFEATLKLGVGSDNKRHIMAMVNQPINSQTSLRLSVASITQDGYVKSVYSNKDFGNVDDVMWRAQLAWEPIKNIDVLVKGSRFTTDNNGAPSVLLSTNKDSPFIIDEQQAGYDATQLKTQEYKRSYQTAKNYNKTQNKGVSVRVNWQLAETLDLKFVSAFRQIDVNGAYDVDATLASIFEQEYERDIDTDSHEATLKGQSKSGDIDWLSGLFYYHEKASEHRYVGTTIHSTNRSNTRIVDPIEVTSMAVFGQATYRFTPRIALTAGIRYTNDEKSIAANELDTLGIPKLETVHRHKTWGAWTGRLNLEYQLNPDVFLFTSFARGYRSGGFNDRIRTNLVDNHYGITDFDDETLHMWEVGSKAEFFSNKLRVNTTIFYGDYKSMQLGALLPNSNRTLVQNSGDAIVSGVESELTLAIINDLTFSWNLGYLDTEYKVLADDVTSVTLNSDFPRSPRWSHYLSVNYFINNFQLLAAYGWQGKSRTVVADNDFVLQDAYGLLDVAIIYQLSDQLTFNLYGTNLTDKVYAKSGLNLDSGKPLGFVQIEPGRFREIGLTIKYQF